MSNCSTCGFNGNDLTAEIERLRADLKQHQDKLVECGQYMAKLTEERDEARKESAGQEAEIQRLWTLRKEQTAKLGRLNNLFTNSTICRITGKARFRTPTCEHCGREVCGD